ncbi:Metallo-dependent hydrolase [Rhizodiscina lignyota]|uniref:adenosine deaminase n=1 Tax=Rhizodiscina lignyota TaxID=1504668 RepID=A0A9P4IHY5_9PEZI|nr:Metallo-dependent hydrolase [Rhizodiscina lignyota]
MDPDEEWEATEGVPRMEDKFIQQYLNGRDALVAQEKQKRSDRLFREALSPTAFEACAIVDQIRFEEQQTLWTPEYEDSLSGERANAYPGMMFMLARDRMEKSKLWNIVRRMPKGALLHSHLEAMVDLDWLLKQLFETEGIYIKATAPLQTPNELLKAPFIFQYCKTVSSQNNSIWTESYPPNALISIKKAAESFSGGEEEFVNWLRSRLTITYEESLKHHEGVNEVWRKFTSIFPIIGSLLFYEPIFRKWIRRMFEQLRQDGVQYVELRHGFVAPFIREGADDPDEDYSQFFKAFGEELKAFQATEEGKNFWGARIIWSGIRRFDKKMIIGAMKECIEMKKLYPDLVAGFDFVGQEDLGRPLAELVPEIFWFKKRCVEEGVDIPFFFHAGECLGDGDSTDENLFDAILLGTRRIGHGFSLYKHPLLIDMVKDKKILIESCPISNEVLRLSASIMSHPLPSLLARGVPCSLSNDDPAFLGQGSNGMTHDFWQALQGWDNLGLAGLGSLAENSVRWAAFEDCSSKEWLHEIKMGAVGKSIRATRLQEWLASWEDFCRWVVSEYGADEDFERE